MAQKKITDLQLIAAVTADVNFPADDTIQSYRVTALQIKNYILSAGAVLRSMMGVGAVARKVYTAVSATYAVLTSDDVVAMSGASFTVTLPTAVGVSGRVYELIHQGTSYSQVYTIATTSGQTVGGIASGSYALWTNGEVLKLVSDGANWLILDHKATTKWEAWTPSGAWNTNSTYTGMKRRVGDVIQYAVKIALTGAPNSVALTINLPSTDVIDTAKFPATPVASYTPMRGGGHLLDVNLNFDGIMVVNYHSTTAVKVKTFRSFDGSTFGSWHQDISNTVPHSPGLVSGDYLEVWWEAPIVGLQP